MSEKMLVTLADDLEAIANLTQDGQSVANRLRAHIATLQREADGMREALDNIANHSMFTSKDGIAEYARERLASGAASPSLRSALGDLIEVADGTLAMLEAKRKAGDFDHWESFEMSDFAVALDTARAALNLPPQERV